MTTEQLEIDYYSDVLCVWAWIAQPRLDELAREWGDRIRVNHRFVDIFGHTAEKIPRQWGERRGYQKFGAHVYESAAGFEHTRIDERIWSETRPATSMNAHLVLKATQSRFGAKVSEQLALSIREYFFTQAEDIGQMAVLYRCASQLDLDTDAIASAIDDGTAGALLMEDLRLAREGGIKGSPTFVLNQGRQQLYGNVGYRILAANIEELLRNPADEASWC